MTTEEQEVRIQAAKSASGEGYHRFSTLWL